MNRFSVALLALLLATSGLIACDASEPKRLRTAEPPSGTLKLADVGLMISDRDPTPVINNHLAATTLNIGYVSQNFAFKTTAADGNFTLIQTTYTPVCSGASPILVYLVGLDATHLNLVQPKGRVTLAPSTGYILQVRFSNVICSSLSLDFAFQRIL